MSLADAALHAELHEVIGHYTPLTRKGEEWEGVCPIEQHPEPLAVIGGKWRCYGCGAHEAHGDDAAGFLKALGVTELPPEWTPTLLKPTPKPGHYALARITERPDAVVLVTDHRKHAKVAAHLLPKYAVVAWPDGGSRWDGLEPIKGRAVLLWPSPEGAKDMAKLGTLLSDPEAFNCTGKVVNPLALSDWTGNAADLIAWAKANVRPLRIAAQNPADRVAERGFASPEAGNVAADSPPPLESPPPPAGPDSKPAADGSVEAYAGHALGRPASAPDWSRILECTKQGPLNNLDNVVRVIENDPTLRGHIWYDEFLDAIVSDWQGPARQWRDSDDVLLQLYVQRHVGLNKIGVATVHDAALVAAFRNVRNECREWLESLEWDQTARLEFMLHEAFGAEQSEYMQAVGKCWFISMVARVMDPGCKVDTVPVLEGAQGVGKSSALKIIGGKWFAECHESVLTKDWYGVLDGHMLVEISEMHSFTRGEVERVKGLISCQVDRYRKAYGRNTEDHPRQSVLVCTTNRDDWQRDDTGARRFWPVLCGAIDQGWLTTNRENLFAEAMHLYRNGVAWWHVNEAEHDNQTEQRRDSDAWEHTIEGWLHGRDKTTTSEILSSCLNIEIAKQEVMYQRRVARAMRALRYTQKVLKENGVNKRTWLKR